METLTIIDSTVLGTVSGGFPGSDQTPKPPKDGADRYDRYAKPLKRSDGTHIDDNMPTYRPKQGSADDDMVQPPIFFPPSRFPKDET